MMMIVQEISGVVIIHALVSGINNISTSVMFRNLLFITIFSLYLLLDPSYYVRKDDMACSPQFPIQYKTQLEATRMCLLKEDCSMLFDVNGNGNQFVLCTDAAKMKPSTAGSILYVKSKFVQF